MKKVLAALLAVLLLTCVFATVAMAAPDAPAPSDKDLKKYNYGDWITMVNTTGKTPLNEGDHVELDLSDVEKPSDSEIEAYLNARYVADPPRFTVRCVNGFHVHAVTDEGDLLGCYKGWVKESTSHYACDGGYWKVVKTNGNVVTAQWKCPYLGKHQQHNIFITVTYKAPHTHTPGEWVITKEPTCTEKGEQVQKCTTCEEVLSTKEIDALNHDWDEGIVTTEPTCTTPGVKTFTCKRDASHVREEEISVDPNAHDWGEWVVTPSTCVKEGDKVRTCKLNEEHKEAIKLDVDPNNHVGPLVTKDLCKMNRMDTCEGHQDFCTACEQPVGEKKAHRFGSGVEVIVDGEKCAKYTCLDCGHEMYIGIDPSTEPTAKPTVKPTEKPTEAPTTAPTEEPTAEPTAEPTEEPTTAPTEEPTAEPTAEPTTEPTAEPSTEPSAEPSVEPSAEPTKKPGGTKIPKTGDNSHFGYAYLMIAVAAAGLCVLAATRRKEGSK